MTSIGTVLRSRLHSMWHVPESAFKRGAMGLFMAAIALLGPFLNHPSKDELGYISTVLVFATCGLKMINPKAKNVTKGFDIGNTPHP